MVAGIKGTMTVDEYREKLDHCVRPIIRLVAQSLVDKDNASEADLDAARSLCVALEQWKKVDEEA